MKYVTEYRDAAVAQEYAKALATSADVTDDYLVRTSHQDGATILDWGPMIVGVCHDLRRGEPKAVIARRFHQTLATMMLTIADSVRERDPEIKIALTGGCFQNRLLTELAAQRLTAAGHRVYWHQRIPPNDGGIALGQIVAAARNRKD